MAVTQMAPFTREVFAARPQLRMIGVCRGGPVNVDLEAATEAGVLVSFAPGPERPGRGGVHHRPDPGRRPPDPAHRCRAQARELARGPLRLGQRRTRAGRDDRRTGRLRRHRPDRGPGAASPSVPTSWPTTRTPMPPTWPGTASPSSSSTTCSRRSMVVSLHARLSPETTQMIDARALDLLPARSAGHQLRPRRPAGLRPAAGDAVQRPAGWRWPWTSTTWNRHHPTGPCSRPRTSSSPRTWPAPPGRPRSGPPSIVAARRRRLPGRRPCRPTSPTPRCSPRQEPGDDARCAWTPGRR